jgi:hypothetical protein
MRKAKSPPVEFSQQRLFRLSLILTIAVLILSGLVYRSVAARLESEPVQLDVPLSTIPLQINSWVGEDVEIPISIQAVAGNDDFINRTYKNDLSSQWANLYVAYTGSPRTMIGHRPQKCYPAGGWIHDGTSQSEFTTRSSRVIPCLVHKFHQLAPDYREIVVLNFYVVNGKVSVDEKVFTGLGWRTPNIAGDAARYVAQIQINSVLEKYAHQGAVDLTDSILKYLPKADNRAADNEDEMVNKP